MRVETIKLAAILIDDRIRKDVDNYHTEDLQATMSTSIGQIQPIAVKELAEPSNGFSYKLLAGGRRCVASQRDGKETIAAHIYPSTLTEEEELQIELIENLARQDNSWDEYCDGVSRVHAALKRTQELKDSSVEWTIKSTAELLGLSVPRVSQFLNLSDTMKLIPDLRRAKNISDALNAEAKLLEDLITKEKADRARKALDAMADVISDVEASGAAPADGTDSANAILVAKKRKKLLDSYICGDMFKLLRDIPDAQFDIVEFDPDYGIDFLSESFGSKSSRFVQDIINRNYQAVSNDVDTYAFYINKSLTEIKRVMKPDSWLIMWFSLQNWYELITQLLADQGFEFTRRPAIWYKDVDHKSSLAPNIYLAATYETFIYARLGNAMIKDRAHGDVYVHKTVSPDKRIHPTEKPVSLMQEILYTFGQPNQRLLVPHAGSGNTMMAGINLDMHPLGMEISPEMKDRFTVRCEKWQPMMDL